MEIDPCQDVCEVSAIALVGPGEPAAEADFEIGSATMCSVPGMEADETDPWS